LNLWEKNAIFPPNLIKELFQAHQSMLKTDEFLEKCEYRLLFFFLNK